MELESGVRLLWYDVFANNIDFHTCKKKNLESYFTFRNVWLQILKKILFAILIVVEFKNNKSLFIFIMFPLSGRFANTFIHFIINGARSINWILFYYYIISLNASTY